ncbi:MAG TPA: HAMP domain-containing sensor histidine kinase [Gaiellales bacterium]|nr:HAMP domain-containing sensor histidine kinase [Gaiellales bacterium]
MTVVSLGVGAFVYQQVRSDLRNQVDLGLRARAQAIMARPAQLGKLAATSGHLADNDESYAQLLSRSGRVISATRSASEAALATPNELRGSRPRFIDRRPPGLDQSRLLIVPVTYEGGRFYLVLGATLSDTSEALERLILILALALPAALLVSSLIGWWLAGAALAPVRRMSREAAAIDAARPEQRLAVPRSDPGLATLAMTLNRTFDRLQVAIEREHAFAANASHELRTPLTILKAEVDTALSRDRPAAELREALASAASEVEQLIRIAEGLLVIARSTDGRLPVDRRPTRLRELVADRIDAFADRAAANGVTVVADADDAVAELDPLRARQALDNLLDNALRHARSEVHVEARAEPGSVRLTVADDGPGFSAAALDAAFQPFNHAAADHGGAGLGLALSRAVAEAHGGTAVARNREGGGAEVVLRLPSSVRVTAAAT